MRLETGLGPQADIGLEMMELRLNGELTKERFAELYREYLQQPDLIGEVVSHMIDSYWEYWSPELDGLLPEALRRQSQAA